MKTQKSSGLINCVLKYIFITVFFLNCGNINDSSNDPTVIGGNRGSGLDHIKDEVELNNKNMIDGLNKIGDDDLAAEVQKSIEAINQEFIVLQQINTIGKYIPAISKQMLFIDLLAKKKEIANDRKNLFQRLDSFLRTQEVVVTRNAARMSSARKNDCNKAIEAFFDQKRKLLDLTNANSENYLQQAYIERLKSLNLYKSPEIEKLISEAEISPSEESIIRSVKDEDILKVLIDICKKRLVTNELLGTLSNVKQIEKINFIENYLKSIFSKSSIDTYNKISHVISFIPQIDNIDNEILTTLLHFSEYLSELSKEKIEDLSTCKNNEALIFVIRFKEALRQLKSMEIKELMNMKNLDNLKAFLQVFNSFDFKKYIFNNSVKNKVLINLITEIDAQTALSGDALYDHIKDLLQNKATLVDASNS